MKKSLLVAAVFISISFMAISQSKDLPYTYYPSVYDTLTAEDWPKMKETFELFLSFKSLDEINHYSEPHKARFTLLRIATITWDAPMRNTVSSYLSGFLVKLLNGESYLKIEDISLAEYPSANHPVYLPKQIIRTLFIIDNETACSKIKEIWDAPSGNLANFYLSNLTDFTFWLFENNNDPNANAFFLDNYEDLKNRQNLDKVRIDRIKAKCEISGMSDQKSAWEYLYNISGLNDRNVLTDETQFLWYDNIKLMEKVFGTIDLETIIDISKGGASVNKKYMFLYSACFAINHKLSKDPGFNVNESVLNYLDNASEEMKAKSAELKKGGGGKDFFMQSYDSMKSNLSERIK